MRQLDHVAVRVEPALRRLSALAQLDTPAWGALNDAMRRRRTVQGRRDLMTEGELISEPLMIVDGWAARFRQLEDGRRQIINLLLPGDIVGLCDHQRPLASSSVVAITNVDVCAAPDRAVSPTLATAYALSRALDEAHLLAHITRLGRMNAHERMSDLLLELLERLELAGLSDGRRYSLPLTQELLADILGLTSVHVNRTLQGMRKAGDIVWKGRELVIVDPLSLHRQTSRISPRVSGGQPRRQLLSVVS